VTLLPFLLLNGQHAKNDVPRVVARLQAEFPQIPITLLPCLGDWKEFGDMVVSGLRAVENNAHSITPNSEIRTPNRSLLSIELNLEGRNVLVVGGGRIAFRKVKTLLPTGARITVVASQFDPEFEKLTSKGEARPHVSNLIAIKNRPYEPLDLRGIFMVFICTDQPAVNAQVSNDARARRILVNNACDYLDGDFIVPARMDFGENIAVTVSTQGRAPSLAKKLKQKILAEWGEDLARIEQEYSTK
jgi:precorrin-2 dehydrogenase/sirohydrochlorin ferrochelatase